MTRGRCPLSAESDAERLRYRLTPLLRDTDGHEIPARLDLLEVESRHLFQIVERLEAAVLVADECPPRTSTWWLAKGNDGQSPRQCGTGTTFRTASIATTGGTTTSAEARTSERDAIISMIRERCSRRTLPPPAVVSGGCRAACGCWAVTSRSTHPFTFHNLRRVQPTRAHTRCRCGVLRRVSIYAAARGSGHWRAYQDTYRMLARRTATSLPARSHACASTAVRELCSPTIATRVGATRPFSASMEGTGRPFT